MYIKCVNRARNLSPLFLAVDCGPLSVPMNGSSSGDSTVFPNSVQFDCDPGFTLNGSRTRTCQANRTWSGFQALCSGRFEEKAFKNGTTSWLTVRAHYR